MKMCQYNKHTTILLLASILIGIEIIIGLLLFQSKEYSYKRFLGIVVDKNKVLIVVDKEEQKLFHQNNSLILQDKEKKYEIIEVKESYQKNKIKYYELLLNIKIPKNKSINDGIEFSIKEKKESKIELLKSVWGGD